MIAQLNPRYLRMRPTRAWSRLISYSLFEGRPLTTRGRWINPLVFAHLALEKRLPQLKRVDRPVFVLGTGRSGTTILGVVLSIHPEVGFLNEPRALWHSVFPHEDVLGNYTDDEAFYELTAEMAGPEVVRAAHRLYGAYLLASGCSRVLDKAEWMFRVPFLKAIFPDAKFVFLVRNGWDTCQSIHKWSERLAVRKGDQRHDWWGANDRKWHVLFDHVVENDPAFSGVPRELRAEASDRDRAMLEWTMTMRKGLELECGDPDAILRLRYEDLTEDPRGELSRLLEFCELPVDPTCLAYGEAVLKPVPARDRFDPHPALGATFEATMIELGYE